jgi:hypothetical protein
MAKLATFDAAPNLEVLRLSEARAVDRSHVDGTLTFQFVSRRSSEMNRTAWSGLVLTALLLFWSATPASAQEPSQVNEEVVSATADGRPLMVVLTPTDARATSGCDQAGRMIIHRGSGGAIPIPNDTRRHAWGLTRIPNACATSLQAFATTGTSAPVEPPAPPRPQPTWVTLSLKVGFRS